MARQTLRCEFRNKLTPTHHADAARPHGARKNAIVRNQDADMFFGSLAYECIDLVVIFGMAAIQFLQNIPVATAITYLRHP